MQKRASSPIQAYNTQFSPIPAEQGETVYFSGLYTALPYAEDFPFLHYHDRYEIGICEDGEGLFLSEGVFSSISQGDLVFIPPSRRHYSRSLNKEKPCICRFAYLRAETVEQLIRLSSSDDRKVNDLIQHSNGVPPVIRTAESPEAASSLKRIIGACAKKTPEGNTTASLLFSAFIVEARKLFQPFPISDITARADDEVALVSEYLSLRYADSDSSKVLAQKCHLSESQLRRRFVKTYGMPPIAYRNLLRCRIGAELLTGTDIPVSQISCRVGFQSSSDFYRAFIKIYGCSPLHYRVSHK